MQSQYFNFGRMLTHKQCISSVQIDLEIIYEFWHIINKIYFVDYVSIVFEDKIKGNGANKNTFLNVFKFRK